MNESRRKVLKVFSAVVISSFMGVIGDMLASPDSARAQDCSCYCNCYCNCYINCYSNRSRR